MSTRCLTERSANSKEIVVGLNVPTPNFLNVEYGIRFTLARRSYKTLLKPTFLFKQGIENLLQSLSFGGNFSLINAVHSSLKATVSCSSSLLFLNYNIFFRNFLCVCIFPKSFKEWSIHINLLKHL